MANHRRPHRVDLRAGPLAGCERGRAPLPQDGHDPFEETPTVGESERSSSFRRLTTELRFRLVGQAQKEAKGGVPFARLKAVSVAGEGRKRVVSLAGAKVT